MYKSNKAEKLTEAYPNWKWKLQNKIHKVYLKLVQDFRFNTYVVQECIQKFIMYIQKLMKTYLVQDFK